MNFHCFFIFSLFVLFLGKESKVTSSCLPSSLKNTSNTVVRVNSLPSLRDVLNVSLLNDNTTDQCVVIVIDIDPTAPTFDFTSTPIIVRRNALIRCPQRGIDFFNFICGSNYCFRMMTGIGNMSNTSNLHAISLEGCNVMGALLDTYDVSLVQLLNNRISGNILNVGPVVVYRADLLIIRNMSILNSGDPNFENGEVENAGGIHFLLSRHFIGSDIDIRNVLGNAININAPTLVELENVSVHTVAAIGGALKVFGDYWISIECMIIIRDASFINVTGSIDATMQVNRCGLRLSNVHIENATSKRWGPALGYSNPEANRTFPLELYDVTMINCVGTGGGVITIETRKWSRTALQMRNVYMEAGVALNGAIVVVGIMDPVQRLPDFVCMKVPYKMQNMTIMNVRQLATPKTNSTIFNRSIIFSQGVIRADCPVVKSAVLNIDLTGSAVFASRSTTSTNSQTRSFTTSASSIHRKNESGIPSTVLLMRSTREIPKRWMQTTTQVVSVISSTLAIIAQEPYAQNTGRFHITSYAATPCVERVGSYWEMTWDLHPTQTTLPLRNKNSDHYAAAVVNTVIVVVVFSIGATAVALEHRTQTSATVLSFTAVLTKRQYPGRLIPVFEYFHLCILAASCTVLSLYGWDGVHAVICCALYVVFGIGRIILQLYMIRTVRLKGLGDLYTEHTGPLEWYSDFGAWKESTFYTALAGSWITRYTPRGMWYVVVETLWSCAMSIAVALVPSSSSICHTQSTLFILFFALNMVGIALYRPFVSPIEFWFQMLVGMVETSSAVLVSAVDTSQGGDVAASLVMVGSFVTACRVFWKVTRKVYAKRVEGRRSRGVVRKQSSFKQYETSVELAMTWDMQPKPQFEL